MVRMLSEFEISRMRAKVELGVGGCDGRVGRMSIVSRSGRLEGWRNRLVGVVHGTVGF